MVKTLKIWSKQTKMSIFLLNFGKNICFGLVQHFAAKSKQQDFHKSNTWLWHEFSKKKNQTYSVNCGLNGLWINTSDWIQMFKVFKQFCHLIFESKFWFNPFDKSDDTWNFERILHRLHVCGPEGVVIEWLDSFCAVR